MPSYLISFITVGELGAAHGSHVVDLPEAPSSARAVVDLQASMAMEYGGSKAILITWDVLPDGNEHPSGGSPYCYFATYSFMSANGEGQGSQTYLRSGPIQTLADVRSVEEWMRSDLQVRELHLVSCKALKEPTAQLLQDYRQMTQQPGNHHD